MLVYAVDVGTTNVKVLLYGELLDLRSRASAPAPLVRSGDRVEFDPDLLFDLVVDLINRCARGLDVAAHDAVIVLTGQAESLVLADGNGDPVRAGLSWLDDRAVEEAAELEQRFGADAAFAITGEPYPSPTWPAAKLRWLAKHEPETLQAAERVLMVKDALIGRFTGSPVGEVSTRGFSYLWDVRGGRYWADVLAFCDVAPDALPEVTGAGSDVGDVLPEIRTRLPEAAGWRVNCGALDHFCAIVGTGSYRPGAVSESAGTVLSLSVLAPDWTFDADCKVSFHSGLLEGDVVLFNGVDSGGVALDWYRREGLDGMPYAELEDRLGGRAFRSAPYFLPYLTGVNPPDYFPAARGGFLGLDLAHDRIDMAFAVEEGIAHLLRRNLAAMAPQAAEIVSTGGGTASGFYNQLKADVCGVDVLVPEEAEATCRGAAVLALRAAGRLSDFEDAQHLHPPAARRYAPSGAPEREARFAEFTDLVRRLFED